MSTSENLVLRHSNINENKILFDDLVLTPNKKYVISKMWYQQNETSRPVSMFIQTSSLKIYETTKTGDIILVLDKNDSSVFEKIDGKSVDFVKSQNVTKNYNLKNVKYKTIVSEVTVGKDENINALKIRVMTGENPTKFFVSGNKKCLSYDNAKSLLANGNNVKIILEIDGIIVDLQNNTILTNVIPRQILIQKLKPRKCNLSEYSFIDSDNSDDENKVGDDNVKDASLNTQTEYLDQNTTVSDKESKLSRAKQVASKKNDTSESSEEDDDENDNLNDSEESDGSIDVENFIKGMASKMHSTKQK